MKSAVRQRHVQSGEQPKIKKKVSWDSKSLASSMRRGRGPVDPYLSWHFILLYLLLMVVMSTISLHFFCQLPEAVTGEGRPNTFHSLNARGHMEDLVALGVRHVGSEANEVQAKNLILRKLETIRSKASEDIEIEVSIQHPSASYFLDFLGGLTHVYHNVTNVVARLSRKGADRRNAFLVNAHFDSALGTVAASDDALSCGIMLEAIRSLSSDPAPLQGEHALIFLFNGAEETILQASHGFITQHPWAKTVRAFLNLEAAGAGGKEIVFQTGPDHPWLAELYSESVPHPHASIVAQEVFQSGVIPSDTDFRIFRDFGHVPGIDTAYFVNGYVYHTEYDVPSAIPNGSIQRAGDNVLAILRSVANAPELSNPSAADKHGKVIFFDILGLMTVVYPERVAMVMNFVLTLLVVLVFVRDVNWSRDEDSEKPTFKLVLVSLAVMLLSWLAALLTCLLVAGLLTFLGRSMSYYSQPLLIIPLYAVPAALALGEVHTQLVKRSGLPLALLEKSSHLSVQLLWCLILFLLTCLHVCSAFMFFLSLFFQLLFRTLLHDLLISPELRKSGWRNLQALAFVLCSALAVGIPWMLRFQLDVGLLQLFVPLTGRSGAVLPPDLAIGGLTAVMLITVTPYMVGVLVYSSSRQLKRWAGLLLLVISLLTITLAGAGYFNPYSTADKSFPKPKRLFIVHTDRTFHSIDQSVSREDSQVLVFPFDYLGLEPVAAASPQFRQAVKTECEGLFCSEPIYLPVRHMLESWTLPAPRLTGRDGATLKLISSEKTSDYSRNMTFQAKFPLRCTMLIGTAEGVALKAWSLESYVPMPNTCPGSHQDRGCYFVFYARGFGQGEFSFWIETDWEPSLMQASQDSITIAVSAHYLDPPLSVTIDLQELESDLPEWVTPVSWTAVYKEWVF